MNNEKTTEKTTQVTVKTDEPDAIDRSQYKDGLGKTVAEGIGKAVSYPVGVTGNLMTNVNAVEASVNPGKAMGQSMLVGIIGFIGSLLLGNGLLGSLGIGLGCGVMGQEIKTMTGNLIDTAKGNESIGGRKFLTTAIPLLISMVLSSKLGPAKAIFTTVLGGALGSRLSNKFMGSGLGERYYGNEYVSNNKPQDGNVKSSDDVSQKKQAEELERGRSARPDIAQENHSTGEDTHKNRQKEELRAVRDSLGREQQLSETESADQTHKSSKSLKL